MNFNANFAARPPGPGRKVKRVSDVNAMGAPAPTPYMANPYDAHISQPYVGGQQQADPIYANSQLPHQPPAQFNYNPPQQPQQYPGFADYTQPTQNMSQQPQQPTTQPQVPFGMFQQPIVQDMAMQYGQRLADQGKQMVESHFEKYVPVTRLKYYFAVDNRYVINKLRLLFFPFTHSDWSLKYDHENPVQPRFDLNAPDLYIPTMAYITYVVLAGLVLGMQNKFSPEDLGKQASTALAIVLLELCIYSLALYIAAIPTTLKTLDLLAYSGYKFTIMVMCIVASILFSNIGYWVALGYCCAPLAFFMTRTLYTKLQSGQATQQQQQQPTYDAYGVLLQPAQPHQDYSLARTRKLYFTGFVVCCQIVISWWLSRHLVASRIVPVAGAPAAGQIF